MFKKSSLILLFLFCTVSYAGTICYYVDPGASGANDGGRDGVDPNDPTQEDNWTDAFPTLAAGETAVDGIAAFGHTYRFYCRSSNGADDTTNIDIANWTDANIPIEIYGHDFPTDGKYDNTKYTLDAKIAGYTQHLKVYHIQFLNNATGTTPECSLGLTQSLAGATLEVDSCIFIFAGNSTGIVRGISSADGDITCTIKNTLVTGFNIGSNSLAIYSQLSNTNIYNSIITNNYVGISRVTSGTVTVTNCAVFNNTDDISGTVTITYCAGDDADFDSGTGNIGWDNSSTSWNANFIDYTTGNFTPILDSQIYHTGTNLSLTTALNGISWDNPPSIGAFEYVAGAPAVKKPRIININMN